MHLLIEVYYFFFVCMLVGHNIHTLARTHAHTIVPHISQLKQKGYCLLSGFVLKKNIRFGLGGGRLLASTSFTNARACLNCCSDSFGSASGVTFLAGECDAPTGVEKKYIQY